MLLNWLATASTSPSVLVSVWELLPLGLFGLLGPGFLLTPFASFRLVAGEAEETGGAGGSLEESVFPEDLGLERDPLTEVRSSGPFESFLEWDFFTLLVLDEGRLSSCSLPRSRLLSSSEGGSPEPPAAPPWDPFLSFELADPLGFLRWVLLVPFSRCESFGRLESPSGLAWPLGLFWLAGGFWSWFPEEEGCSVSLEGVISLSLPPSSWTWCLG